MDNGRIGLLPVGVVGEICIGGLQVARGYLNRPELTAEKFVGDPFSKDPGARMYRTGDLGRWLSDGNIEFLGRMDDQVKIRGYRIEPGEIERVLEESGLVRQAVVVVRGEESGSKRLIGYVVPAGEYDKGGILSYASSRLPEYMVPGLLVEIGEVPLTANGKIDRGGLPDPDMGALLSGGYEAPGSELEMLLVGIWEDLLGVDRIGIHDNFFELGGDSIITIQVVSRLKRMGYEIRPRDLFEHQTIGRLSASVMNRSELGLSGEQGLLSGESGLLPIQQWYLDRAPLGSVSHFNQSVLLAIEKEITVGVLDQAFRELVSHHDGLRFRYQQDGLGFWHQGYGDYRSDVRHEDLRGFGIDWVSLLDERADVYQRSLDIEKGKLLEVVLIETPLEERANRLLIVIHHLVIDGVSWRILLGDLDLLIRGIRTGGILSLGSKSSSYRQWYDCLSVYGKSRRLGGQRMYWESLVRSYSPLRVDNYFEGLVRMGDTAQVTVRLGVTETRDLLQSVPRVYHTEVNDLLLSALARTICSWMDSEAITVGLEGHGREWIGPGIDTSRTLGWFTNLYPVLLEGGKGHGAGDLIKGVKEQLRRVPDKGIGYGVLKYLNKESVLASRSWDIVFNYLGQLDTLVRGEWFGGASERAGLAMGADQLTGDKMVLNSRVQAGEFIVQWSYSRAHYELSTIQQLADRYITVLKELINHCLERGQQGTVHTPSDYGLGQEISYQELDRFLDGSITGGLKRSLIKGIYRLSGLQEGMFFHSLYDIRGGGSYVEQLSAELVGVDAGVFIRSWEFLLRRHSILRSGFYYDAFKIPVQCVYGEVSMPAEVLDYRDKDEREQALAIQAYEEADRRRGFDFKVAPLMRIGLLRLSESRYRLLWTHHHMIMDGWSMPVLIEELLKSYDLLMRGEEVDLGGEDRYEDYIRYIEGRDKEGEEAYWRKYLEGLSSGSLLPFVRLSADRNKGQGIYRQFLLRLDEDETLAIERYAQRNRITVNTVMQGVWSYLLSRYTGSVDVIYGVTVSGRPDDLSEVEQRVGMYINTLPVRTRVREDAQIRDWLGQIQGGQLESREYQYSSLSNIQRWAGVKGDLFDTLLVFENYPLTKTISERKWELCIEEVKVDEHTNYLLSVTIVAIEKIAIRFDYNSDLLSAVEVERIGGHFDRVLRELVNMQEGRLRDLEMLSQGEREELLEEFNGKEVLYPRDKTVVDLFIEQASRTPEGVAVVYGDERITYRQLDERSNQVGHYLRERHGVVEETLVGICMERGVEMLVGLLGILKAGGAYVPVDPDYPGDRIGYMLLDSGTRVVLSSEQSLGVIPREYGGEIVSVDGLWSTIGGMAKSGLVSSLKPHHLAYVIYTSGSTGRPKGVMIEHSSVVNRIYGMQGYFNLGLSDRIL